MSWCCLMLLLFWVERLALHALYAFEDWSRVKPKFMTPEKEEEKKAWLREFHEVFLCGCEVRDVMFGKLNKSRWSHLRLYAESVMKDYRKEEK